MKIEEVSKWKNFVDIEGNIFNLSHLDAHAMTYTHSSKGKADISYKFIVSYSFHCFSKDYPHLTNEERQNIMYFAPKDERPFCLRRYELSKQYLRGIVENLGTSNVKVFHAGYGSYATTKILTEENQELWYMVPFRVFKENKKYRIHITSAFPTDINEGKDKGKVGFFKIAYNLSIGKELPKPQM
ncbi:stationary phase growth adaptation protein [Shewanella baltica]|uniref:stationary phase growth adaptation protein n=1 Tax=Shewanella baltica TaxID=62322 RepID=UPI0007B4BD81|nr:stationary phase growth adaptation protein [Shewanella baltica]KZK68672.1 stationary phase growth adaptation protein [Shewanella baltica]